MRFRMMQQAAIYFEVDAIDEREAFRKACDIMASNEDGFDCILEAGMSPDSISTHDHVIPLAGTHLPEIVNAR